MLCLVYFGYPMMPLRTYIRRDYTSSTRTPNTMLITSSVVAQLLLIFHTYLDKIIPCEYVLHHLEAAMREPLCIFEPLIMSSDAASLTSRGST